jgi:microcystin-dependent protein
MSTPYIGSLMLAPYTFAPVNWMFCQGQLLPISQFDALYNLIGTTYGGDGVQTFALPDLRGRTAIGIGQGPGLSNYVLGQQGGVEVVVLNPNQNPAHNHVAKSSTAGQNSNNANASVLAGTASGVNMYTTNNPATPMAGPALQNAGGSQPHDNHQPFLVLNWCIAVYGVYPPPS